MIELKSEFLHNLQERDYLYQCSNLLELDKLMSKQKISAYIGFDCTATSLHIGSLVQIMLLRQLQITGHKAIALLGGGTTLIGDPSGKDESRKILTLEDINKNMEGIKTVLENFIYFSKNNTADPKVSLNNKFSYAEILNNAQWLTPLNYLEFLRNYGKEFTINRMLSFDSVKLRLEKQHPLTFLEFNYMLLQAVDFLHLNKTAEVVLQLGGSDQWGNIINGVELIRRLSNKEAFALTTKLVTKSDGTKMGKTAQGAIWLTKDKSTPWELYQYFRNITDEDTTRFLKLFTDLSISEITKLDKLTGKDKNEAKKILAFEVTKICHGLEEADKALILALNTFDNNKLDLNLPTFFIQEEELTKGILLTTLLTKLQILESNSQGKRLIENYGLKVNDSTIKDINFKISKSDLLQGNAKISLGKKQHILLRVAN
ncbi:Tyrosine--tRNA ligase [Candidatus Hepatincolaceae symbiont of Richtersius coronifer]